MGNGLKVGLAGVGTVGGGLLQLLAAHGDSIAARAGRRIDVVAVSTLEHRKNPNVDISRFRRVPDPVALAQDPEIDVFVELMGGEGGVAKDSVEAALSAGKHARRTRIPRGMSLRPFMISSPLRESRYSVSFSISFFTSSRPSSMTLKRLPWSGQSCSKDRVAWATAVISLSSESSHSRPAGTSATCGA